MYWSGLSEFWKNVGKTLNSTNMGVMVEYIHMVKESQQQVKMGQYYLSLSGWMHFNGHTNKRQWTFILCN